MSQLSLDFEKIDNSHSEFIIFHDADLRLIESLHLPTIIRFHRADKFDSKFVQTTNDVWSFSYSGKKLDLNFSNFSTSEKKLAKFFLANYIQVNTPSALEAKLQAYTFVIKSLKTRNLKLDYPNTKSLLVDLAKSDNSTYYYHFKFLVKLLFLENFSCFDLDYEYELEFLERPKAFNSRLYYQQYEDAIDYPLISMIQQGFIKLNQAIKDDFQGIDKQTLLYSSILGLVYVTGLRPVQLAKLSAEDIKIDTTRITDHFHRYSILIPYAKQARYVHEKIAVKLPEEVAEIILAYIERFNLSPKDKLFDLGVKIITFQ